MKRFLVLLCVICVFYGLSWANNFGLSIDGENATITLSHTTNCDSGRVWFGYQDTTNWYVSYKLTPAGWDNAVLLNSSVLLDSIGTHVVRVSYWETGAGSVSGYVAGIWTHEDPTPGDTIQRNASTFDPSTDVVVRVTYVDSAETVITQPAGGSGSDTTAIKAMHDNRGTSIFDPTSDVVARVTFVDSTDTIIKSVGATAVVDTEAIGRSAWDDDIVPEANRTVTASCAGSGADTFDIYVFNGDTTAQEGVDICIYNQAKTAKVVPSILTNVNGMAQVFLDAGTYPLYLQRLGVIYSQWDTITVSNGGIDTLWVTSYDPGSSPAGNLTTVKGFNRDFGFNKGERLTVTFSLPYKNVIDTSQNVFIDRKEITVYSDTGFFEGNLIPGIFLLSQVRGAVEDSLKYNVKISAPGRPVFEWNRFDVPDTTSAVWLIDLIR